MLDNENINIVVSCNIHWCKIQSFFFIIVEPIRKCDFFFFPLYKKAFNKLKKFYIFYTKNIHI